MDALILAAGGVLSRVTDDVVEVALIHRPRFDDWSLPKGKVKRGEHPMVGACREVWEETGVWPRLGVGLPSASYRVPAMGGGEMDKSVRYWSMTVDHDDSFVPGPESDGLAWLAVAPALARLTYERDILVLQAFAALPPLYAPVVLVRHATADGPAAWSGPDDERPLDPPGVARARLLGDVLACFAPARLISAAPRRCLDTLAPLAARVGEPVQVEHAFDEDADAGVAAACLAALASDRASVVCSQGKLIPPMLAALTGAPAEGYHTAKGDGWVLSFGTDGALAALDPLA